MGTIPVGNQQDTEQQFSNLTPAPSRGMSCVLLLLAGEPLTGGGGHGTAVKCLVRRGLSCQGEARTWENTGGDVVSRLEWAGAVLKHIWLQGES